MWLNCKFQLMKYEELICMFNYENLSSLVEFYWNLAFNFMTFDNFTKLTTKVWRWQFHISLIWYKRRKSRIKDLHKIKNLQVLHANWVYIFTSNILCCVLSDINEVCEDIREISIAEEKTPKQKVKLFKNFYSSKH